MIILIVITNDIGGGSNPRKGLGLSQDVLSMLPGELQNMNIPSERFNKLSSESISHKLIQSVNGPMDQPKTLSTPVFPDAIKTALKALKLCAH